MPIETKDQGKTRKKECLHKYLPRRQDLKELGYILVGGKDLNLIHGMRYDRMKLFVQWTETTTGSLL